MEREEIEKKAFNYFQSGFNDLLLGFAAATGSFGSGMMFAARGYGVLGLVAASAAVVPLGLAVWWQVRGRLAPSAIAEKYY